LAGAAVACACVCAVLGPKRTEDDQNRYVDDLALFDGDGVFAVAKSHVFGVGG